MSKGRPKDQALTISEAAALLAVPVETLRRRIAARPSFFCAVGAGESMTLPAATVRRIAGSRLEQLWSVAEAAAWLGVSPVTVRRAIKAGKLSAVLVLGELRVRESALVAAAKPAPLSFFRGKEAKP